MLVGFAMGAVGWHVASGAAENLSLRGLVRGDGRAIASGSFVFDSLWWSAWAPFFAGLWRRGRLAADQRGQHIIFWVEERESSRGSPLVRAVLLTTSGSLCRGFLLQVDHLM